MDKERRAPFTDAQYDAQIKAFHAMPRSQRIKALADDNTECDTEWASNLTDAEQVDALMDEWMDEREIEARADDTRAPLDRLTEEEQETLITAQIEAMADDMRSHAILMLQLEDEQSLADTLEYLSRE